MRFHYVQDVVLVAVAAVGLSVMLLSGATGLLATVIAPFAFVAAALVPLSWRESPRWRRAWTVAAIAVFAAQAASAAAGASILEVTAEMAVYLLIHKLLQRTTARDHQQIALLALAQIAFATILLTGLRYAALLVFFVFVAPLFMALGFLRKEIEHKYATPFEGAPPEQTLERVLRTRRIATPGFVAAMLGMAVPLFLLTGAFFMLIPRLGVGLLAMPTSATFITGFSDRMVLGDLVPLIENRSPVMRVEFPDGAPDGDEAAAIRFRGTTFHLYDGRSWRKGANGADAARATAASMWKLNVPGGAPDSVFRVRVLQEPVEPSLLFLPAGTVSFRVLSPVPDPRSSMVQPVRFFADGAVGYNRRGMTGGQGADGPVLFEATVGRWPYGVRTPIDGSYGGPAEADPYMALPPGPEPLVDLAERLTAGINEPGRRAEAIARYLQTEFKYDSKGSATAGDKPLDDFLFKWKRGYCEHFSSAMTLLARAAGLRARNAAGFLGGRWNDVGGYLVVRQQDAHSWSEVEIPGVGWVVYDATPPGSGAMERTGGVFGWVADLLDTLQTSWQRHVLAFDLGRQARLFDSVAAGLRAGKDAVVAFYREHRSAVWTALGAAVAAAAGILAWRRLRRFRRIPGWGPPTRRGRRAGYEMVEARRLLADLERILRRAGVERAAHEPAERLVDRARGLGERLGDAAGAAVRRYLVARFGGGDLAAADRRVLIRRVSAATAARR